MKILIVEDEPPIALDIKDLCEEILKDLKVEFTLAYTLTDAITLVEQQSFDLCLLDLNLSGEDGFDLLKRFTARFYTIIISAYSEKAIRAFEYGVLDFVPKPFSRNRLRQALDRYFERNHDYSAKAQYLIVYKQNAYHLVPVGEIIYFRASRYLVEIHLKSGKVELIEKSLNALGQTLPPRFLRIHRSFIVDREMITDFKHHRGGRYQVTLRNGEKLPVNRQQYRQMKNIGI